MHEYSYTIAFPKENSNLNILGFLLLLNATDGIAMQSTRELQFSSEAQGRAGIMEITKIKKS